MFAKKNLIALAALATLAVSAQAQSSVTLYGNVDAMVGSLQSLNVTFGPTTVTKDRTTAVASSGLTESFFGLKGQEDMGGGLKAVFKLESFVNVDTGTTGANFFGKNAYVGFAGDFGQLVAGNVESLFKIEGAAFNPFGTSPIASPTTRLFLGGNLGVSSPMVGGSWQNTLAYTSNNMSGLTLSAQYSAKEASNYGGAYDLSANYTAGALGLSAVYGESKQSFGAADLKSRAYLLGASYDFTAVKLMAQYGQNKITQEGVTGSTTPKFYQVGVVVPVSAAGSFHAAFGQNKIEDLKMTDISVGYNHALSKRTSLYALYINEKFKLGGDSESTNSYGVGVRHAF